MNAKEERGHNLEMHKMARVNHELTAKNVALDAECKRLRLAIKQESEKHAANHAAMMQRVIDVTESEREKMNALQRQFEKEYERLTEHARKDAVAQRASHLDALSDIKRHLDAKCNEKINENKRAFDAEMQKLNQDREQIKREEQEQLARLNKEREQVNRQMNETREQIQRQLNESQERIKRDEQEQLVLFVTHMELEREKIHELQRQLETERALLAEQAHKDAVAQRQSNLDVLADMKQHLDAQCNEKVHALDTAMQQLDETRDKFKRHEQEQLAQLDEERDKIKRQLDEERDKIKRQLDEERDKIKRQLDEERDKIKRQLDEEREHLQKTVQEQLVRLDEEREHLQKTVQEQLVRLDEEREHLQKTVQEQHEQLNEDRERIKREDQAHTCRLNEEREQVNRQLNEARERNKRDEREQLVQFLTRMELEREKMQSELKTERAILAEQAHKDADAQRQSNADALDETKRHLDAQCNEKINEHTRAFDAAMKNLNEERDQIRRQLYEEHEKIKRQLDEERDQLKRLMDEEQERNKRGDLERAKMHALQTQLETERARLAERAHNDAVAQRQSNADALAEVKQQLAARFNATMNEQKLAFDAATRKLDEERERIKRDNLERDKMQHHLEKERALLAEQTRKDAVALRQSNADALAETKQQLNTQYNEKITKNKLAFDATMQQLNEEREQIKRQLNEERERNKRDELEREKTQAMQSRLEKERERLSEQAYKDTMTQRQSNLDALTETKRHLNAKCNEKLNEHKLAFDVAMQKLNEDWEQKKCQLETERTLLAEQAQKDAVARQQSNLSVLDNMKRNFNARCNEKMKEQTIAFDAAMQKLNEEQQQLKPQMELERKKMQDLAEQMQKDAVAQRQSNADALAEANQQLEASYNEKMKEHTTTFNIKMKNLDDTRNEKMKEQTIAFDDAMRKLDEDRNRIKRDDLERKRLAEHAQKDAVAMRQFNADALAEAKRHMEAGYAEKLNELNGKTVAMRQFNADALAEAKRHMEAGYAEKLNELNELNEKMVAMRQFNSDALAEAKRHLEADYAEKLNELNEKTVAMRQFNADALADAKRHLEAGYAEKLNELNKLRITLQTGYNEKIKEVNKQKRTFDEAMERIQRYEPEVNGRLESEREIMQRQMKTEQEKIKRQLEEEREKIKRQLEEEREKIKRQLEEEQEKIKRQSNDEFKRIKRQLDEERGRIKRDEQEKFVQHMTRMEELNKLKAQLDEEPAQLIRREQKLSEEFNKLKAKLYEEQELHEQKLMEEKAQLHETQAKFKLHEQKLMEEMNALKSQLHEEQAQFKLHEQKLIEGTNTLKAQLHVTQEKFKLHEQKLMEEKAQLHVTQEKFKLHEQKLMEGMNALKSQLHEEQAQFKLHEQKLMEEMNALKSQLHEEQAQFKLHEQKLMEEMNTLKSQLHVTQEKFKLHEQKLMEEMNTLKSQLHEEQELHKAEKLALSNMEMQESRPLTLSEVSDAIAENHAQVQLIHRLDFKGKRVVIYSHYSEHDEVESYNWLTIECIQHYFDHIVILTNCPNKWIMQSPNYNKYHFMAYNLKSDFRNYGLFIMQTAETIRNASQLCFVNDSFVVVDVISFGRCVKRLFETDHKSCDFFGLTSSHECVFHLQSYFMGFNANTLPAIVDYFETRGLPANHHVAISEYELKLTEYLINKKFTSHAIVSNDDMRSPLNTTCCKWSTVLKEIGIVKRQHFFKKYAYAAMTDANIAFVAEKYSYNKHLMHFLKYHRITS